jgi:Sulfotransferase domain
MRRSVTVGRRRRELKSPNTVLRRKFALVRIIPPKLGFVIGGAQKAGTATLDAIFRTHPQLQMADIKETHFFDDESLHWDPPDYCWLDECFAAPDNRMRGEATPITLFWRPAIRRLHAYNPSIKIILLLRNPVERAFSNWQHEYAAGRETLLFKEAIREKGRVRLAGKGETDPLRRYFSYIERGFYACQLGYLMQYFPSSNIHCELLEEFSSDQPAALRRMSAFLGIEPFPESTGGKHIHRARNIAYPSQLEPEDRDYLAGVFRADVADLEALLRRSLSAWTIHAATRVNSAPTPQHTVRQPDR